MKQIQDHIWKWTGSGMKNLVCFVDTAERNQIRVTRRSGGLSWTSHLPHSLLPIFSFPSLLLKQKLWFNLHLLPGESSPLYNFDWEDVLVQPTAVLYQQQKNKDTHTTLVNMLEHDVTTSQSGNVMWLYLKAKLRVKTNPLLLCLTWTLVHFCHSVTLAASVYVELLSWAVTVGDKVTDLQVRKKHRRWKRARFVWADTSWAFNFVLEPITIKTRWNEFKKKTKNKLR